LATLAKKQEGLSGKIRASKMPAGRSSRRRDIKLHLAERKKKKVGRSVAPRANANVRVTHLVFITVVTPRARRSFSTTERSFTDHGSISSYAASTSNLPVAGILPRASTK
jgi:hypothetical protein